MNAEPLISIVIPVYNREKYIESSLDSACKQTYANLEIIVIDNASTDSTVEKLQRFISCDSRVKVVKNAVNVGRVENWNLGLSHVNGEYFMLLMSDDMLELHAIESMVEQLKYHNNIAIVSSGHKSIPEQETYCRFSQITFMPGKQAYRSIVHDGNWLAGLNNNLFSTKYMRICGGFNTLLSWGSDWGFYLAMLAKGDLVYIPETLSIFRNHPGRLSDTGMVKSFFEDWIVRKMAFMQLYYHGESFITLLRCKLAFSFLSINYLLEQKEKKNFNLVKAVQYLIELGKSIGFFFCFFATILFLIKKVVKMILPKQAFSMFKRLLWGKNEN